MESSEYMICSMISQEYARKNTILIVGSDVHVHYLRVDMHTHASRPPTRTETKTAMNN